MGQFNKYLWGSMTSEESLVHKIVENSIIDLVLFGRLNNQNGKDLDCILELMELAYSDKTDHK